MNESRTKHLVIETRNGRDGTFYAVGCDLCSWWDDENDNYHQAFETGERHLEMRHPTRQEAADAVAHRLYERSDQFDPEMPKLWQRSGTTSSYWQAQADEFIADTPWLAAFIESLPDEDEATS